jgi:LysM repeat protein
MGIKKTLLLMRELKLILFFCLLTFAVSCGQQKKYVEYKVAKGETMRSIARKLDIKTKDLRRMNPDVRRRPAPNTIIIIPNTKSLATANAQKETFRKKQQDSIVEVDKDSIVLNSTEDAEKFLIHEVKKGDTFYNLTRFYNVSKAALISLNPELSDGLKLFQKIKVKHIEENANETIVYNDEIREGVSLKVALLLPFRVSEYDTVAADEIFDNSRLANYVTDFYMGAELAIDSLRSQGVPIELNVYDTERNSSKIRTVLEENDLDLNDVIIGPLYSEEALVVANEVETPLVFPVYSKNQSNFKSSKIIKTAPDKAVFSEAIATHIKDVFEEGTITIVSDGDLESEFHASKMSEILQDVDSLNEVQLLKAVDGYIEKERFLEVFKQLTNNWVVLATSDNVVVSDAINSLISLPDSITAKVFSMDKGKAFDKIDDNKLARVGFTYVNDRFVDENSEFTKTFNQQYVAKNNSLPSFYATKGFDITYDILVRLASGTPLKETFKKGASYRVESKFNYSKQLFETTQNKGLFILQYNEDLTLTRLK